MLRKITLFMLACTVVLTAVGCGGSAKTSHKALSIKTASDVEAEGATTTLPAATAGDAAKKSASKTAAPAATASQTPTTWNQADHVVTMPSWFTITLDKQCMHAQETEGFTVHGGMPGQLFIYDTAYANGTDDYTTHYGTGSGRDKFDAKGDYRTTFVLAGNVPPGSAVLSVASAKNGGLIQTRAVFDIKPLTQPCT
jgi:hypothetical protein